MADSDSAASSSTKGKEKGKNATGRFRSTFKRKLRLDGKKEERPGIASQSDGIDAKETQEGTSGVQEAIQETPTLPINVDSTVAQCQDQEGPIQELWNQAYEELKIQDEALINDFEKCLQGDVATAIGSSVLLSGSKVDRRVQMRMLLERRVKYVEENTWKFKFAGQDKPVKDLAEPVVGIIRWADEYISGALDSNPYASIAWAGVGLLLPLLLNPSKQAASLAKGLEYILELIVRSKMREELYERRSKTKASDEKQNASSHTDTLYQRTLKKLYIQILKFHATVIRYLSKNGAFRLGLDMVKWNDWDLTEIESHEAAFCEVYAIWKDLKSERDSEEVLARHRENIENLSAISCNTASLLDAIRTEHADGKRNDLLNWLSSVDSSKLYNSGLDKVRAGTGEWLLTGNANFEAWKVSPNSFIWLNGKAGSGKSVLSSSIIHHLEECYRPAPDIATAFFYFRFDDAKTQSVDEMLCALIKQICVQRPITPPAVQGLTDYKVKGHRPDRKTLERVLVATAQGFEGVYVVLDALDECPLSNDKREELLKSIRRIHEQKLHNVHLLCTSRRENDVERALKGTLKSGLAFDIDLSARKETVDRDIGLHIDETFKTDEPFCSWKDEWKDEARRVLIENADGMFQYVALQFKELKPHKTRSRIQKALKSLPKDLDDTYTRILENIHPEYRKQVANTLKWLAFSNERLVVEQIAEIFILDHEEIVSFDEDDRFDPVQDVLIHLSGLITHIPATITDFRQSVLGKSKLDTTEIKFAHFSIQEYLSSDRLPESQACFSTHEQASHLHISEACLAYHLHLSETILVTKETIKTYFLWHYAARNWTFHLEKVPRKLWTDSVKCSATRVLQARSQHLLNMVRLSNPDTSGLPCFEVSMSTLPTPLYNICRKGLKHIASHLIEQGAEVNEISPHGLCGTPIQAAACDGHDELVNLLLEHGAKTNMEAGYWGSALVTATAHGRLGTLQLLLDRGADINASGGWDGTPLAIAAAYGYIETMQLLLHRGADVNAKGGVYGNALQSAIANGASDAVDLLLAQGAEIVPLHDRQWEELPKRLQEKGLSGVKEKIIHRIRSYSENPEAWIEEKKREEREKQERKEKRSQLLEEASN